MSHPVIGILGGMGPAAGIDLATKLTEETEASRDQDHCPVMLFSVPDGIPDRTSFLLGHSSADPAAPIADALIRMAAAGVTVAGIACNTAHAEPIDRSVRSRLRSNAPDLNLLHLIDEAVAAIGELAPDARSIGILGTQGTYRFKLYESRLKRAGFECVIPPADIREGILHEAIYHEEWGIKANARRVPDRAREGVRRAAESVKKQGADAVILGCTELPLAIRDSRVAALPVIDPARALARALLRESYPDRLRPWSVQKTLTPADDRPLHPTRT